MSSKDVAEQLKRHALITALAANDNPAVQRVALLLAAANAANDEEGWADALNHIPGYTVPTKKPAGPAVVGWITR